MKIGPLENEAPITFPDGNLILAPSRLGDCPAALQAREKQENTNTIKRRMLAPRIQRRTMRK
jgi:hypothetical protein